ncbi:hypothetical protein FA95DRAFT_1563533 [Auriscalpium vulgare]|uniref:Uncharacterized protein n=1 Tax=Auriscalpium vulgare TaxID=40419 RepID=A0ACB8RGB4_9AGAM|nr:hypothetical protein FA95DRAFT_1563533 [Auriscalpium vulgare]
MLFPFRTFPPSLSLLSHCARLPLTSASTSPLYYLPLPFVAVFHLSVAFSTSLPPSQTFLPPFSTSPPLPSASKPLHLHSPAALSTVLCSL